MIEGVETMVGIFAGVIAVVGGIIAVAKVVTARRHTPGTYDHLDNEKTYEGKEFVLLKGGRLEGKDAPRSGWRSNFRANELEIWWGDCRITVTKTTSGVYEGYYMKGRDRTRKVRIQKRRG